jgi:hypothetical protein
MRHKALYRDQIAVLALVDIDFYLPFRILSFGHMPQDAEPEAIHALPQSHSESRSEEQTRVQREEQPEYRQRET